MSVDLKREACLIGGRWVSDGPWADVTNPSTGKIIGKAPNLGAAAAQAAIDAAADAMPAWAARSAGARALVLRRFFELMMRHQEDLATLLTEEQGKPLAEARGEIAYAAGFLEWFGEEAKRVYGDTLPGHAADKRLFVLKQPVGVVAAITPWNFPSAMITRKIAPALAAGCAVVLKPALQTPFSALALGVLAQEAGLPPGLLNIITGDAVEIGGVFTASPVVRKISFTGSTAVGVKLLVQSAPTVKKVSLELGGNAPLIVFDDADIEAAVRGAMASKFRNAGQTCVCVNRIYVQEGLYETFVDRLAAATLTLKVGDGFDPAVTIGPLIDEAAIGKLQGHIADATAKGATIVVGGERLSGLFFQPTVLRDVTSDMVVTREETFGPLAPVLRFTSEAEVMRLANDSEFGLAAYVYTRDISRAWRTVEALEAGIVGVNTGLVSTEAAPFGGVKSSGLGREGSKYGIEDYLELKYVCVDL